MLSDRDEIYHVVLRYCRGIDRMDFDLVRSAYHPNGVEHHTGFNGGIDEYIEWLKVALTPFDGTQHLLGNHFAEISGNSAVVETYLQATHWGTPIDDARINFSTRSRYLDHMERIGGRWAIVERWAVRDCTFSNVGLSQIAKEGDGPSGRRDADDPVFQLRAKLLPPEQR